MSTAVAKTVSPINNLKAMLERGKGQLQLAMAEHLDPDRMIRLALTAASKNPKLLGCTQESIGLALLTASQIGLEPNGRDAHLVPYKTECQFIPDYKGLVKLAFRNPRLKRFYAHVVYANEEFEIRYGTDAGIRHIPMLSGDRGEPIGAYAVAQIDTAEPQFIFMTPDEIKKRQEMSKAGRDDAPWKLWPAEMWKKTVAKNLSKWLPLGDNFDAAVEHDNKIDTLDVTFAEPTDLDHLTSKLTGELPDDRRKVSPQAETGELATPDQVDGIESLIEQLSWGNVRKKSFFDGIQSGATCAGDLTAANAVRAIESLAKGE